MLIDKTRLELYIRERLNRHKIEDEAMTGLAIDDLNHGDCQGAIAKLVKAENAGMICSEFEDLLTEIDSGRLNGYRS